MNGYEPLYGLKRYKEEQVEIDLFLFGLFFISEPTVKSKRE